MYIAINYVLHIDIAIHSVCIPYNIHIIILDIDIICSTSTTIPYILIMYKAYIYTYYFVR